MSKYISNSHISINRFPFVPNKNDPVMTFKFRNFRLQINQKYLEKLPKYSKEYRHFWKVIDDTFKQK